MGSIGRKPYPKPWVETPLIESAALSKAAGCRIFLKLENLQPSGSFKSRGIGNLMLSALRKSSSATPHFYSSSGGNAGLACATSATSLGCPSTVVVPHSTSPYMIAKISAAGASAVIQHGDSWKEADTHLCEEIIAKDPTGVYVPPFDHEDIWTGHSTLVEELQEQFRARGESAPEALVCSVGGGGLFCGAMMGMDKAGWNDTQILAMETQGANSLHSALAARELVSLDEITSIATTLGAKRVCAKAFEFGQRPNVKSVVLRDAEAAMGCWRLADDERILVEPACGVSVAVCYDGRLGKLVPNLKRESKVVVIVCGGSNVTLGMLMEYRARFGWVEKEMGANGEVPSKVAVEE